MDLRLVPANPFRLTTKISKRAAPILCEKYVILTFLISEFSVMKDAASLHCAVAFGILNIWFGLGGVP